MAAWIRCTTKGGDNIWLNLDEATRMFRLTEDLTRVCFSGDENEYEDVKEAPDVLVGLAIMKKHIAAKHIATVKFEPGS